MQRNIPGIKNSSFIYYLFKKYGYKKKHPEIEKSIKDSVLLSIYQPIAKTIKPIIILIIYLEIYVQIFLLT